MRIKPIFSLKNYTVLLFATALLGTHVVSLNLGFVQLSPYRILLFISPFVFVKVQNKTIYQFLNSKNYGYFLFLLFWAIYSFLPLLWVEDFEAWLKLYVFLVSGLITSWLIGIFLKSKYDIITALRVVEIVSVIFGIIALYEILTGNYLFVQEKNLNYFQEWSQLSSTIAVRIPVSVFGNPNDYALFLLFSVFSCLGLAKLKKTRINRLLSLLLTFGFVFILIATQSRSAFIGLIIGFALYTFVSFLRMRKVKMLLISMCAMLFIILFLIPFLGDNSSYYKSLIEIDTSTGSDEIRVNLIKNGFDFLGNSWFLGVGLGNIEYHMAHSSMYFVGGVLNIHNWWMEILVSSGIIVFFLYVVVYLKNILWLFRFSIRTYDKELQHIAAVFFCFLTAFFITSMGASSLMYNEWIWPVIALVMTSVNVFSVSVNKN